MLDIEKILDLIAFDSYIISLPETNPILWKATKQNLEDYDIKDLNEYRRKLKLVPCLALFWGLRLPETCMVLVRFRQA